MLFRSKNAKWFSVLLVACCAMYFSADPSAPTPAREIAAGPVLEKSSSHRPHAPAVVAPVTTHERAPAATTSASQTSPAVELRSLDEMADTVASATQRGIPLKNLVERLQKSGQQPRITRDANPYSGEMIVVRADAPLEGTRYFHAQYFVGEDGLPFVQHMSFEFKPGPNAMNEALAAVQKNFPGLAQPTHSRDGYARWKLDENRILWVKRLTQEDVAHDPFNAYSPKDYGAVRVAVESEIHD